MYRQKSKYHHHLTGNKIADLMVIGALCLTIAGVLSPYLFI